MSELRVNKIAVSTDPSIEIASPMNVTNSGTAGMSIPVGTTAQRHSTPTKGMLRWNSTYDGLEVWTGTIWFTLLTGGLGTLNNPAPNGVALKALGLPSGVYYIKPTNEASYQMYVDNDRNGGGWVLCARVTTASCQAHVNTGSVGLGGNLGPRTTDSTTTKMSDAWMNALRSSSTYSGSTAFWMEATGFSKNVFISSAASVDLVSSASTNNERTRISTTYEGSLDDRNPNTGTRGFGDHHTSAGTYFAWGRHPEDGNNCGFREDTNGSSNGFLWVK